MTQITDRLTAWRTVHKIEPIEDEHPTFGRITRCSVDGIRVHWITKAWRHDQDEVVALLDEEYGGAWGFPKQRAIERLIESIDIHEDDDDEFDREGQPEFNGAFR